MFHLINFYAVHFNWSCPSPSCIYGDFWHPAHLVTHLVTDYLMNTKAVHKASSRPAKRNPSTHEDFIHVKFIVTVTFRPEHPTTVGEQHSKIQPAFKNKPAQRLPLPLTHHVHSFNNGWYWVKTTMFTKKKDIEGLLEHLKKKKKKKH